jgi:hypothetical protein
MSSGLYDALAGERLLVLHQEAARDLRLTDEGEVVIRPEEVPFVSYPYEWCFSQLKRAALATLEIERLALERGMTLKDASAFNIQFNGYLPVHIDTLSFERYAEGSPWRAYRQFCQHFLAPLALASRVDVRLTRLLRFYIDGFPLDLASKLLPRRTLLSFPLLVHLHAHASAQARFSRTPSRPRRLSMSRRARLGLVESLAKAVQSLKYSPAGTVWVDYYENTNYTPEAVRRKKEIVAAFLERTGASVVWDLGANTGVFSRIASRQGRRTVSFDFDPAAVERNYLACVEERDDLLLPLVMDLTNPTPALGWAGECRASLAERGPADAVLALALVHHIAIGNNVPFDRLAEFLARLGEWLVIEFVPKSDSQVVRLLASREDVFSAYDLDSFERAFRERFAILATEPIEGSERVLYLMRRDR